MPGRTVIAGGTVVTEHGGLRTDLIIDNDRIVGFTSGLAIDADERIDASGLLIMPGAIDAHTHFWEPDSGNEPKEGFRYGSLGAAAGGVTTVVEMPQANPTATTAEHLETKKTIIKREAIIDMALWGGVIGEPDQDLATYRGMINAGAVGLKSFMASSSRNFPAMNDAKLLNAMLTLAEFNLPYALHAEHDVMVASGLTRMREKGRTDPLAHAESRLPIVEAMAVNTALYLAELTGCWVHFCHVASADALHQIAEARSRGVKVTCETCPQYLTMTTDDLRRLAGLARCAPALRDGAEVDAIWPYVLDETVDVIASDHCGFTLEEKNAGRTNIFQAPMGLPGVQTLVPVTFDATVVQRGMDVRQFVRQISTNPAQMFGLYPRKGTIKVGADADLMLLDPGQSWSVRDNDIAHRQKWTPYVGRMLTGRVVRTIRRGETIFDLNQEGDRRFPALPGSGRFLSRSYGAEA